MSVTRRTPGGAVAACVAFDYSTDGASPGSMYLSLLRGVTDRSLFALAASAALDNAGEKFVPGLCKACHGSNFLHDVRPGENPSSNSFPGVGDKEATGDVGVKFLLFDLDSFDYGVDDFSRSAQEGKFKQLNQMIFEHGCYIYRHRTHNDGWYRDETD